MRAVATEVPDVLILEPRVFDDERGFFYESYNAKEFATLTGRRTPDFVQDNHSSSRKGVLRGMHYQVKQPQGKLVRCIVGEIFDVAVDIRRNSPTFGAWVGVILSEKNKRQLWIPEGFAHGFLVLSDSAEIIYKTTEFYAPALERAIAWNDPVIGILWPIEGIAPVLSNKDALASLLNNAELP